MKLSKIIGIAGTNGAGKDTLGELLAERCGYKFRSVSDILREELTKQNIPHEREHLRALSTAWAKEHGPGVLSVKTIEAYVDEEKREGYKGLAIGSIRRPGEAKAVQDEGGIVIWVDADRRLRHERVQANNRGRTETDNIEFEEWAKQEDIEMTPPEGDDGSAIDMSGVRAIADIHIDNNFDTFGAYRDYLIKEFEL
jgi:dephospho-CoA kinase